MIEWQTSITAWELRLDGWLTREISPEMKIKIWKIALEILKKLWITDAQVSEIRSVEGNTDNGEPYSLFFNFERKEGDYVRIKPVSAELHPETSEWIGHFLGLNDVLSRC